MMVMAPLIRNGHGGRNVGDNDTCYAAPPQDKALQNAMAPSSVHRAMRCNAKWLRACRGVTYSEDVLSSGGAGDVLHDDDVRDEIALVRG